MIGLDELFRSAAADDQRGAGEIERDLIRGLLDLRAQWNRSALASGAQIIAAGLPAMGNLRSLAWRLTTLQPAALAQYLRQRADTSVDLGDRLARSASDQVRSRRRIVTVSRSSAVAAVVRGAWRQGWQGTVLVLDGTDAGRGQAQAELLAAAGKVISQPDGALLPLLDQESLIVVGADAVSSQRFVNATGTRILLELAAARDLPRMVVADHGKDVPEQVVDEMVAAARIHHQPGPGRSWPVFEAIPLELVNLRISESGVDFAIGDRRP